MKDKVVGKDRDVTQEVIAILEKQLSRFDRGGFRKELARALGIRPTDDALQTFANKYPDKWGQLVTMLAGLSGFQSGINVTVSGGVDPSLMTDVALLQEVKRLSVMVAARARGAAGEVVDAEVVASTPPVLASPASEVSETSKNE